MTVGGKSIVDGLDISEASRSRTWSEMKSGPAAGITENEQSEAFRILRSMVRSLRDGNDGA